MLHEILLSLSGIPSPIWDQVRISGPEGSSLNQYVSPPERAMVQTLSNLQDLHIKIKEATATIAVAQPSMICRALSSSIADVQLARFMDKIIQVESSILNRDAGYVAAYGIVPLSTLVAEFAPWTRRLEWLSSLIIHLQQASGAAALDRLERERHTGYSDIEDMANELLSVGQLAWMRAANLWILFGKLPTAGLGDFCVKANPSPSSSIDTFLIDHNLLPGFVNSGASHALLSIGNALNQLHIQALAAPISLQGSLDPSASLLPAHLKLLESLRYPISPSHLESVLVAINHSISENALSQILPVSLVMQMLRVIHSYFLLGYGEFAVCIVAQADERVIARQQIQKSTAPIRKTGRLDDLTIKDIELSGILKKSFSELAAVRGDYEADDEIFELAQKLLRLKTCDQRPEQTIISTLLPNPVLLHLTIPPSSPLHIFLSSADIETYSRLNAYLLSLRRAGLHIAALWKVSAQRRCHPTPLGPPRSASQAGQASLIARRIRDDRRNRRTRLHWASVSKALFTINELEAYLQGEVIQSSWKHLCTWINGDGKSGTISARSSRPGTASSAAADHTRSKEFSTSSSTAAGSLNSPSDPRTLAEAHRAYLEALSNALLVSDQGFAGTFKELLLVLDHFVALFHRLQAVWEGLDLQEDEGVVDAFSNYEKDEKDVLDEMDRTAQNVESTLNNLVDKIRNVEMESRANTGTKNVTEFLSGVHLTDRKFVPWRVRTVDRLIMKLDSLAGRREEDDRYESGYDDE